MLLMDHQMAKKKTSRPLLHSYNSLALPNDLTTNLVEKLRQFESSPKVDYLNKEVLSKYVSKDTDPEELRRNRAIFKWLVTERENEATNDRLLITSEDYNILPRVRFGSFVGWCRDLVCDILGETVPVDALIGSFSGGASTSRPRTKSNPCFKYLGKAHVTSSCLEIFKDIIVPEVPGWMNAKNELLVEVVPGNVLFTVPKKTDIDRVACKEPDINMFIQKGLGKHIRASLLRIGINLNDQSINQSFARVGSITNELSTLDLSSASDSVTESLVRLLLPETWFTFLDSVRSHVTVIDGEEHRNHMFSSMGNGFTFELESLLFYVLARATAFFTGTRGSISVYGDDIICPRAMSHDLTWVLSYFGFTVNTEKSCYDGPFRESCGGHYFNGLDITPFYIKEPISDLPGLIHVANQLRKWGEVEGLGVLDPEIEAVWLWLKSYVPRCLWGGHDTAYKYQLVSRDTPEKHLVLDALREPTGVGGYLHWLNSTMGRGPASERFNESFRGGDPTFWTTKLWDRSFHDFGVQTSIRSETRKSFRVRKVRNTAVPRLDCLFLHEIG